MTDKLVVSNTDILSVKLLSQDYKSTWHNIYFNSIMIFAKDRDSLKYDKYEGIVARIRNNNTAKKSVVEKRFGLDNLTIEEDGDYLVYRRKNIKDIKIYCFYNVNARDCDVKIGTNEVSFLHRPKKDLIKDFGDGTGALYIMIENKTQLLSYLNERHEISNTIFGEPIKYYSFKKNGEWVCSKANKYNYAEAFYKNNKYAYQKEFRFAVRYPGTLIINNVYDSIGAKVSEKYEIDEFRVTFPIDKKV